MTSTPPQTPRRWSRRKDARPAELLAAALDLFVERGFAGTRLDDVAARAGVSKGTLYLYFENKEELFRAVVRENIGARISSAQAELASFDGDARALLRRLIHGWWSEYGASHAGGLTKLLMAESGNFPAIARFFVEEAIDPWHQLAAKALRRGIERGEFRPVDVDYIVEVLTAALVMLSLWKRSFGPCASRPIDPVRFTDALYHMAAAALLADPDPPAAKPTSAGRRRSPDAKRAS